MAELIRLDRPPADFCVCISGLSPTLEVSKLQNYLREMGGPLWNFVVQQEDSDEDGKRRWAMAFFFCESDCERCRQQCDGLVLAGMRLNAKRATKLRGNSNPAAGRESVPSAKAIEVMNHYVGFNKWSSELLSVELTEDRKQASAASPSDLYSARIRLVVTDGPEVTAEATSGDFVGRTNTQCSASSLAADQERRSHMKKASVTAAVSAALAKLCIIRLPNGKVVVRAVEKAKRQSMNEQQHSASQLPQLQNPSQAILAHP